MAIITWSDEYSVGVESLDKQHQNLIAIINKVYNLHSKGSFDQEEVEPILKELMDYADYHLSTEEHYFSLYSYDKKEEHIALHNQYREKIASLKKDYNENNNKETLAAIDNFLNTWWTWHINNVDKDYGEFFRSKGLE